MCVAASAFNFRYAGQAGYIFCNMRGIKEANTGDTVYQTNHKVVPLPGFSKCKPMVFAGVYPMDQSEHPQLRNSLERLLLNDPSIDCAIESRFVQQSTTSYLN